VKAVIYARYSSAHQREESIEGQLRECQAFAEKNDIAILGTTGILLESLLEGMAGHYSVELAEKIGRGMTENVLKGKSNGGIVTFGYQLDIERYFQVNPLTAPIVLEIYQMYADGKTMEEIRESLNARGICNGRGKPFTTQGIEKILGNRRYIGEYKDKGNIEKWATLKEVQAYLGIGRETVLQWIAKRNMPAYKVGRLWKFKISEIDEWVRYGGVDERSTAKDGSESEEK
jgi:excisionase family DNA binding protein